MAHDPLAMLQSYGGLSIVVLAIPLLWLWLSGAVALAVAVAATLTVLPKMYQGWMGVESLTDAFALTVTWCGCIAHMMQAGLFSREKLGAMAMGENSKSACLIQSGVLKLLSDDMIATLVPMIFSSMPGEKSNSPADMLPLKKPFLLKVESWWYSMGIMLKGMWCGFILKVFQSLSIERRSVVLKNIVWNTEQLDCVRVRLGEEMGSASGYIFARLLLYLWPGSLLVRTTITSPELMQFSVKLALMPSQNSSISQDIALVLCKTAFASKLQRSLPEPPDDFVRCLAITLAAAAAPKNLEMVVGAAGRGKCWHAIDMVCMLIWEMGQRSSDPDLKDLQVSLKDSIWPVIRRLILVDNASPLWFLEATDEAYYELSDFAPGEIPEEQAQILQDLRSFPCFFEVLIDIFLGMFDAKVFQRKDVNNPDIIPIGVWQRLGSLPNIRPKTYSRLQEFVAKLSDRDVLRAFGGKPKGVGSTPKNGALVKCSREACEEVETTTAFMKCQGCKDAAYCCRECQKQDWKRHKPFCGKAS